MITVLKYLLALLLGGVVLAFAGLGAYALMNSLGSRNNTFYKDQIVSSSRSPDDQLIARLIHTRGGMGTVSTVRLALAPTNDPEDYQIIYQTRDTDAYPAYAWVDPHTLRVGMPCDRIDHVRNHFDQLLGDDLKRVVIEFGYADTTCRLARGSI